MTQLIHRAFLATLATGAVVASGAAFGAPAFARGARPRHVWPHRFSGQDHR